MGSSTKALSFAEAPGPRTLSIDVGGTGTKMMVLDAQGIPLTARARRLTPRPARPKAVLKVIRELLETQIPFDRVAVGFPGVVLHGVVRTAPNLQTPLWHGFELQAALEDLTQQPTRVVNDADMQGYGVIRGEGVEMVLTLGTGMGSALFTNGHLVPNFELGHHPFEKGKTYEERVSERELERIGKKRWRKRMARVIGQLEAIWNYDALYVGGGNARYLPFELPDNVRVFENVQGMTGGVRLWFDDPVGGPLGGDLEPISWRPPDDSSWREELVAETVGGESDPE